MKKILLLILLLSSVLLAKDSTIVLKSYSTDEHIDTTRIAEYTSHFKAQKQERKDDNFVIVLIHSEDESSIKQGSEHRFQWIMLELDDNLSSGNYWIEHTGFTFTEHTFNKGQFMESISLFGHKFFSFHYNHLEDKKLYFLKTVNTQSHVVPIALLYTPQTFTLWAKKYSLKMLFSFFLFGLIFMAAIYNGALYLYNHEKSFLYYMLMLFFMLGILVYQTDLIQTYTKGNIENEEIAIFSYFLIVEVTLILILLFIRSFLETKKYLPFHDKILHYITLLAIADLVLFFIPIIFISKLYSILLFYIIWLAWLRLRQGYRPALFFMFGWFALMLGVFVSNFFSTKEYFFDPILIGSTIEALYLSLAISYKMRDIQVEKEEQKEILVQQNKLASMGEMLGNIAHQWRQPLSRMSYILMNIESKDKEQHHTQKLQEASEQLEFMSQTIDDFRSFYAPDKAKEDFSLETATEETLKIIHSTFRHNNIDIELILKNDRTLHNYKNEYKQVLLNLLSNAKDALIDRVILLPKVTITIDKNKISIQDNAGGIKENILPHIFEPYFTTKDKNTGIGLYMSKMIIEKNMGGILNVFNREKGVLFILTL